MSFRKEINISSVFLNSHPYNQNQINKKKKPKHLLKYVSPTFMVDDIRVNGLTLEEVT